MPKPFHFMALVAGLALAFPAVAAEPAKQAKPAAPRLHR